MRGPHPPGSEPGRQESKPSRVDVEKLILRLWPGWFCSNPLGWFRSDHPDV